MTATAAGGGYRRVSPRQGVTTTLPSGPADVCPVMALKKYMRECPDDRDNAPLFTLAGGPFIRKVVVGYLEKALREAGYPAKRFSGHSLRRGAATWASSIGLTPLQIKTLGRWNSDGYKLYIDAGPENHAISGNRLLSASAGDSTLDASGIPRPGQVWRPSL